MNFETYQFEWLVIALIYNHKHYDELFGNTPGYQSMEVQKAHVLKEIEDTVYHPKVKIVLVESRLQFVKENNEITGVDEAVYVLEKTPDTTLVAKDKVDLSLTESMTDPDSLIKLLTYLRATYPARRSLLLTYGHGSIFGINYVVVHKPSGIGINFAPATPPETTTRGANEKAWLYQSYRYNGGAMEGNNRLADKMRSARADNHLVGNIAQNDKPALKKLVKAINNTVILTNKELAQTIDAVWQEGKLDVLVMYNCLMQNIYTQYELKDCVDFLVAPVSGISLPGYHYQRVFNAMSGNLSFTNQSIADLFVTSVRENPFYTASEAEIEDTWKLGCVQLRPDVLEEASVSFRQFMEDLLSLYAQSRSVFTLVNNTLVQCMNYAKHCLNNNETMVDLLVFLRFLCFEIDDGFPLFVSLKTKALALIKVLEKLQVKTFRGRSFFGRQNFADKRYSDEYAFGIVLQRKRYPEGSIQKDTLLQKSDSYSPTFLENSRFYEFYKLYAAYNGAL